MALAGLTLLVAFAARTPVASSSALVQGDADCSGGVAPADASGILGQVAGLGDVGCAESADTNCDANVDIRDALNVLLSTAGITANTPAFCDDIGGALSDVRIKVDPAITPGEDTTDSLDGGPPSPVVAAQDPDGHAVQYVGNEILYKPDNDADLQAFLAKYDGTVLRDGTTVLSAGDAAPSGSANKPYQLIKIDPSAAPLGDLAGGLDGAGFAGDVAFSSEDAASVMAIAVADPDGKTQVSAIGQIDDLSENPTSTGGHLTEEDFGFLTSGPGTLDIGVLRAWSYLRYQEVIDAAHAIPFAAVRVAVIDTGFALDESTGLPTGGNMDFFPSDSRPAQYDVVQEDYTAGGINHVDCHDAKDSCSWHGTMAFGACCAIPYNQYGGAGTGGNYVVPILIRVGDRVSSWADGIRAAESLEADVMSMSLSYSCWSWCGWFDGDIGDAVDDAGHHGRIVVAAAGNTRQDTGQPGDIGGDEHLRPCEFVKAICVGATLGIPPANSRNFGSPVDIWAPEGFFTTVIPNRAARDANDLDTDELGFFEATSSATPFVAGVVALAKSLSPTLTYSQAISLLQFTANGSSDPKIAHGYVNALNAVLTTRPNQPPEIQNVRVPRSKETYGYNGADFRVDVIDPEPGNLLPEFAGATLVSFVANGQTICVSNILTYRDQLPGYDCPVVNAPIGVFNVQVTVTDPFGAQDTATIPEVHFVNTAPIVDIITPTDGGTFYSTQTIDFSAYVFDAEEVYPFPDSMVVWSSDIDGDLGNGSAIHTTLSQGTHTVTITATDGKGVQTQESITLHIQSGAGLPIVNITAPDDGSNPPEPVTLTGAASDPEDGPLTGTSLAWYSDFDGFLGNGESITVTLSSTFPVCGSRSHLITLRATDSDNHQIEDQIHVSNSCIP